MHLSCRFLSDTRHPNALRRRYNRWRPQFRDHAQDVGEEIFGNGNLRHLEGHVARVGEYNTRHRGKTERVIEFAVGEQAGVQRNDRTSKLKG